MPAYGDGSSTSDLAVSISTTMSLTLMTSPTLTFQVTISASVRPSPTSGSLYSNDGHLRPQRPVDGVQHAVEVGEPLLLDPCGRVGRVEAADPENRRLEGVEALLGDPGRDLGAHAEVGVRLVGDDDATGLADRLEDRLHVERREGAQVDDLDAPALLRRRLGGGEAGLHHRAVGQQRDVGAGADRRAT